MTTLDIKRSRWGLIGGILSLLEGLGLFEFALLNEQSILENLKEMGLNELGDFAPLAFDGCS